MEEENNAGQQRYLLSRQEAGDDLTDYDEEDEALELAELTGEVEPAEMTEVEQDVTTGGREKVEAELAWDVCPVQGRRAASVWAGTASWAAGRV